MERLCHILPALVVITAFVFCITCLGLFLAGALKTGKQLQAFTPVLVVSTSMLGGCFWPLDIVQSKVLLGLAKFIPQTWALSSLENIVMKGQSPAVVLIPAGVLIAMGLLFFAAGLMTLKGEG